MNKKDIVKLAKEYSEVLKTHADYENVYACNINIDIGPVLEFYADISKLNNEEKRKRIKEYYQIAKIFCDRNVLFFMTHSLLSNTTILALADKNYVGIIEDVVALCIEEIYRLYESREKRNIFLREIENSMYMAKLHCMYKSKTFEEEFRQLFKEVESMRETNRPIW